MTRETWNYVIHTKLRLCWVTESISDCSYRPETGWWRPQTLLCFCHQPPSSELFDLCKLWIKNQSRNWHGEHYKNCLMTSVITVEAESVQLTNLTAAPEHSVLALLISAGIAWLPASLGHKPGAEWSVVWPAAPSGSDVQRGSTWGTPESRDT